MNYCCIFHTSDSNLVKLGPSQPSQHQFGCKGKWQSGSIVPATPSGNHPVGPNKTELVLTSARTKITTDAHALEPLSHLLSDDIFAISGVRLNVTDTNSTNMETIRLAFSPSPEQTGSHPPGTISPSLPDESYSLSVSGKGVDIRCVSYTGCAWAVATMLQLLCVSGSM